MIERVLCYFVDDVRKIGIFSWNNKFANFSICFNYGINTTTIRIRIKSLKKNFFIAETKKLDSIQKKTSDLFFLVYHLIKAKKRNLFI